MLLGVGNTRHFIDDDVVIYQFYSAKLAYRESDIGKLKVEVLTEVLKAQNSEPLYISILNYSAPKNALALI